MLENTVDCRIPPGLVPRCPVCGGDMSVHVRKDGSFVENASWREKNARYSAYAKKIMDGPAVLLELGVGYNTPGIIRFPFEQMTYRNTEITLIRINRDHPDGAKENAGRTIVFTEDIQSVIRGLAQ